MTYVPIRFVAEVLKVEVGYAYAAFSGNGQATIVTLDRTPDMPLISTQAGMEAVMNASLEMYTQLLDYLTEIGSAFGEPYRKDYNPQDIEYTGESLGRYYVYKLGPFENYSIYFNKYTGEIYSDWAGLPPIFIHKGFINISWLYQ